MVCSPTPATEALKLVPLTPGPEKIPPEGKPFKVRVVEDTH